MFNGFAFDFLGDDARVYPFHYRGYNCLGCERDLVNSLTPQVPVDDFPYSIDDSDAPTVE